MAAVIAAPASGSGKTLLSLALLSWAQQNGRRIQAFKVGPDYLDAQLLSQASGQACRNLDPNLCGKTWVRQAFHGYGCLLYTSPSPRDTERSRMPSSA